MLAFGRPTIPERGVARVTCHTLEFYTPLNISGTLKVETSNFVDRLAKQSVSLEMTNCPQVGVVSVT